MYPSPDRRFKRGSRSTTPSRPEAVCVGPVTRGTSGTQTAHASYRESIGTAIDSGGGCRFSPRRSWSVPDRSRDERAPATTRATEDATNSVGRTPSRENVKVRGTNGDFPDPTNDSVGARPSEYNILSVTHLPMKIRTRMPRGTFDESGTRGRRTLRYGGWGWCSRRRRQQQRQRQRRRPRMLRRRRRRAGGGLPSAFW